MNIIIKTLPIITAFGLGYAAHAYLATSNNTNTTTSDMNASGLHIEEEWLSHVDPASRSHQETTKAQASSLNKNELKEKANALIGDKHDLLRNAKLSLLTAHWAEQDPMSALNFALQNNEWAAIITIITISGAKQDNEVYDWILSQENNAQYGYWQQAYFQGLAKIAPESAIGMADTISNKNEREGLLHTIMDSWATQDVNAAFEWINSQNNDPLYESLHHTVMLHHIEQDPWQAANDIINLSPSNDRKHLIINAADTLSKLDIYDAIDWAETLPPELQKEAATAVLANWVNEDIPDAALDYLLSRPDITENDEAFQTTISSLSHSSPNILVDRLSEFSPSTRVQVAQQVATALEHKEALGDTFWEQLPSNAMRDSAKIAVLNDRIYSNPQRAFELAEQISESGQRTHYINQAAMTWAQQNPEASLNALLSTNGLTAEQRREAIRQIKNTN